MRRFFKLNPISITLIFIAVGIVWILASDVILVRLVPHLQEYKNWQSAKGLLFVGGTGLIIYLLVKSYSNKITRHQHQLKMAEQMAGLCYWSYDLKSGDIEWGDQTYELFDIPADTSEITRELILERIHPDDRESIKEAVNTAIKENQPFNQTFRIVNTDDNRDYRYITFRCEIRVDEKGRVKTLFGIMMDISDQVTHEKQLKKSLNEKDILLQEIHHRVKNNLAIIAGLLQMQMYNTEDETLHSILEESLMRIYSIALVHERLYESPDFSRVSNKAYISELIDRIRDLFNGDKTHITIEQQVEEISININQAIPCAMLINELVLNAYNHAFNGNKEGTITVRMSQQDNTIHLEVRDNGIGLPDNFDLEHNTTLGSKLIQLLTKQLHGSVEYKSNPEEGTSVHIVFDKSERKGSSTTVST